jgi:hypothetical protein
MKHDDTGLATGQIRYKCEKLQQPITAMPGDKLCLTHTEPGGVVYTPSKTTHIHEEEFTKLTTYTHYAFVTIPGIGDAIFCGGENLEHFLRETWPTSQRIPANKPLFV